MTQPQYKHLGDYPLHDPTTAYAQAVVNGADNAGADVDSAQVEMQGYILAGALVRLACERHLRDLETGHERGLYFDTEAAQHALDFFPTFLRFHEGAFAGKPFVLEPAEEFIIGSLFGWKGADGYRRFLSAYIEIGKGNGKTPLVAGIGLYGMLADDEAGAEIYAAAVTRDQANILFTDAKNMVESSPELAQRVVVHEHNLAAKAKGSYFRPVSSEARSLDGKRVHMGLVDEVHEHPTAVAVNKMRAGTKGRRQPLIVEITNSGFDKNTVCWHHHEYSEQVLRGVR